jgi:hypothetical protein
LEDAKSQESKATTPGLMQLLRYDDGTPAPLFFNLYVTLAKFYKRINCLSFLQVFGELWYVFPNNAWRKTCTYEGASLAITYNSLGVIDEETMMNLERVWTPTMFNYLAMAIDSSYAITNTLINKELRTSRLSPSSIGKWIVVKH